MSLGFCSRSNDVIEPMIKPQWFVDCNSMAKVALDAVMDKDNNKIEIIPEQYEQDWKRFILFWEIYIHNSYAFTYVALEI